MLIIIDNQIIACKYYAPALPDIKTGKAVKNSKPFLPTASRRNGVSGPGYSSYQLLLFKEEAHGDFCTDLCRIQGE